MKSSKSSMQRLSPLFVAVLALLLLFELSSAASAPSSAAAVDQLTLTSPSTSSSRTRYGSSRLLHRHCDSHRQQRTRSLCLRFQRLVNHRRPPVSPPPSRELSRIDPRYGVEKRLVPSGPNPLHN